MTTTTRVQRSRRLWYGLCWLAAVLLVILPAPAGAQPEADGEPGQEPREGPAAAASGSSGRVAGAVPEDIRDAVAAQLLTQARRAHERGDHGIANELVVECLELSPKGPHAASGLELWRAIRREVRAADAASGSAGGDRQGTPPAAGVRATGGSAGDEPIDPYAPDRPSGSAAAAEDAPLDPYGSPADSEPQASSDPEPGADRGEDRARAGGAGADTPGESQTGRGRRQLMVTSGLFGFVAGAALGGPTDELGQLRGGAVALSVVGLVSGLGLGKLAHDRYRLTEGEAAAIAWSAVLGSTSAGFAGDALTGIGSSTTNDITRSMALGGLAGLGVGTYLARRYEPSAGDVAVVSSLGLYGMVGGLLVGEVMQPPESEAYSLNAFAGTALGLAAGYLAARRVETTPARMLWVNLAAVASVAAPWALIYPLGGGSSGARQAAGLVSTATLVAGAYIGWRRTAGMDEATGAAGAGGDQAARPVPGLIQRTASGRWTLGMITLRPAENPLLAPVTGRPGVAVEVLGGRF